MQFNIEKFFDLSNFSDEEKAQLVGSLTDLAMAKIAVKIGDQLPEDKVQELENVANSGEPNAVIDWLNVNIPNFSVILDETMAEESQNIATQVKMLTGLALEAKNNA